MKQKLIVVLLVSYICKELLWAGLVPLWHFPDEQSHMAQAAYIAETGRSPTGLGPDLTEEIRQSEAWLGTERDQMGVNKFTYHPEYRIPYTDTYEGTFEQAIRNLATDPSKRTMVSYEASHYPSGYYVLIAGIYRALYAHSLIERVFISRILQLIFSLATVYLCVRIGERLFKNLYFGVLVGSLVAFHPMVSFVSAGVNSDNIGTFVFSLYILCAMNAIRPIIRIRDSLSLILISLVAITVKPQFLIVLPVSLAIFIFQSYRLMCRAKYPLWLYPGILALLGLGIWLVFYLQLPGTGALQTFASTWNVSAFFFYAKDYMIRHLYREVLPWYWGIYDWLGVTYPRPIHRTINWIGILSIGGMIRIVWQYRYIQAVRELCLSVVLVGALVVGIYGYDWSEWSRTNIHLGVQGRYFFPTIALHMSLLLMGFTALVPRRYRYHAGIFLVLSMMILHTYALWLIAKTYYDVSSFSTFVIQASQYKPWFFKGGYLFGLLGLYVGSIVSFMWYVFKKKVREIQSP